MKFKTNINCSGCLAKVTPFLNETAGQGQWKVDINNPDKVLFVAEPSVSMEDVINSVHNAGFSIEVLPE
ncbi:Copper chaperone CopZ [bacterium A37T11]|nr:Copper chaperone CopZ [bacterium A37T11]